MSKKIKGHDEFVKELVKITGLSRQYASGAFFTIQHYNRENPKQAAKEYKKRFDL